ncbi:anaerobic glycerol-3-phosphate dehydrogenase subunit GlpA [Desulfitobacterium sp. AusDCA]|uniref:anaerobic glycerol-3-phosphate dehydrogenase subunit GlpA n=1 Tax=Desulfitobacterium sp. AusDCA TaxID=3240383 RepID=UPI003DA7215A
MINYSTTAAVIGGGATGIGILRDLSMRGISTILVDQGDLAHGTSSRFHGGLHSGARYAVKDPVSAVECMQENKILKHIAKNYIVNSNGWFVQMEDDEPAFTEAWVTGCANSGISVREISLGEAYSMEPLLKKNAARIFEVPDATIDWFQLIWANARSAQRYGGQYKTYHKVEQVLREGDRVVGVSGKNLLTGEDFIIHSDMVINAAGAWASHIAATAKVPLEVICDKGTLLVFNQRLFQRLISRLRPPSDGDIYVPHETVTIFGTTSKAVDSPEDNQPKEDEVIKLLGIGEQLLANVDLYRVIRAFSGVRPLYRGKNTEDAGRNVTRGLALIDHELEVGIKGFVSIVGGKFSTYRLMAEKVTDLVTAKLGQYSPCRTAEEKLYPEISEKVKREASILLPFGAAEKMVNRLGEQASEVLTEIKCDPSKAQLVCECEMVTLAEVEKTARTEDVYNLSDIRRRTRLGMGTCQGLFCAYRTLPLTLKVNGKHQSLSQEMKNFLNQRWKGIRPVLWGRQLREAELTRAIYAGVLGMNAKEELKCGTE